MKHNPHSEVMTHHEFAHLQVCGTCDSWCVGHANWYCDLRVPVECRDEHGVVDWELPDDAIKGPHDTCKAWGEW